MNKISRIPFYFIRSFYVVITCASVFLSLFFLLVVPSPTKFFVPTVVNPKPIPELSNSENVLISSIISACRNSLSKHFQTCPTNDEFRPIQKQCRDSFGFYATILESIETVHLMHLYNLSKQIKSFLEDNFECSKIEWVSRRELWSRAIGSLIGAYFVSSDSFYLNHAEKCASLAMNIDKQRKYPFPFLNLKTSKFKSKIWKNGTSLNEIIVGIPEMLSLYQITKNITYFKTVKRILDSLPSVNNKNLLPEILSIPRGFFSTHLKNVDAITVNFYRNLGVSKNLLINKKINKLSQIWDHAEKVIHTTLGINSSMYFPLLDTPKPLNFVTRDYLLKDAKELFKAPTFKIFQPGNNFEISGFMFDGTVPRILLRSGIIDGNIGNLKILKDVINESLTKTKSGDGYSGISHSNNNAFIFDDIQHSNFYGQWLKVGILLDESYVDIVKTSTFNEKGHILRCDFLLPFQNVEL